MAETFIITQKRLWSSFGKEKGAGNQGYTVMCHFQSFNEEEGYHIMFLTEDRKSFHFRLPVTLRKGSKGQSLLVV